MYCVHCKCEKWYINHVHNMQCVCICVHSMCVSGCRVLMSNNLLCGCVQCTVLKSWKSVPCVTFHAKGQPLLRYAIVFFVLCMSSDTVALNEG